MMSTNGSIHSNVYYSPLCDTKLNIAIHEHACKEEIRKHPREIAERCSIIIWHQAERSNSQACLPIELNTEPTK